MTNIQFTYEKSFMGEPMLTATTNQHMPIYVAFHKSQPDLIGFDGYEFGMKEELLDALFICFGEKVITLRDLADSAAEQFDKLESEYTKSEEGIYHVSDEQESSWERA